MMGKGFFITFEGGEGVGKTTQIKHLEKSLTAQGHDVVVTREPGGTTAAEEIRALLSHSVYGEEWTEEAQIMLLFAARAMHIKDVIAPALAAGKIILCDRYIDSTRVYQGYLQGLDMNFVQQLEDKIVGNYIPDLTFILDLEALKAMARVHSRGATDHYDRGSVEFYTKLRDGFLEMAKSEPKRCKIIDANKDINAIAAEINSIVTQRLAA